MSYKATNRPEDCLRMVWRHCDSCIAGIKAMERDDADDLIERVCNVQDDVARLIADIRETK